MLLEATLFLPQIGSQPLGFRAIELTGFPIERVGMLPLIPEESSANKSISRGLNTRRRKGKRPLRSVRSTSLSTIVQTSCAFIAGFVAKTGEQ